MLGLLKTYRFNSILTVFTFLLNTLQGVFQDTILILFVAFNQPWSLVQHIFIAQTLCAQPESFYEFMLLLAKTVHHFVSSNQEICAAKYRKKLQLVYFGTNTDYHIW